MELPNIVSFMKPFDEDSIAGWVRTLVLLIWWPHINRLCSFYSLVCFIYVQNLSPRFWNRVILIMVILVCSTAGQTGSPGSTSMPGTPTSPKGTGSTGGLNPPDVDSTDSNAEHLATASLPSLALTCFMYMFLQLWWCMDDLVRFSRALGCSIVARDGRDTTTVLF